jgi:hypothetical protein
MSHSYSSLERLLARQLARMPFVKRVAKRLYTRLVFFVHKKAHVFKSQFSVRPVIEGGHGESFFGYYDKSPATKSGLVIAHIVENLTTKNIPHPDVRVTVSVTKKGACEPLFQTFTKVYNWQQGSRAHWLNDDLFIINDVDTVREMYVSKVFSVSQKTQLKEFDHPVQDSYGTKFFLSINYRRLMAMRPDYGYRNLPPLSEADIKKNIANDGVFKVDFETGTTCLLVSIERVLKVNPCDDFNGALHKINHVMISPNGEQFIFIHRYLIKGRRFDRLMIASADGMEIKLLASNGMVSHSCWVNNNTVLSYLRGDDGKDAYWLIDLDSGRFKRFSNKVLDELGDGHPHVCGEWFVTDTYPDKSRMQKLILCNWRTNEVVEAGEFFHDFEYSGETRCDLHPRLSPDGTQVYFDSVFSGKRQLYCLELKRKVS